jgi:hypothetical protein
LAPLWPIDRQCRSICQVKDSRINIRSPTRMMSEVVGIILKPSREVPHSSLAPLRPIDCRCCSICQVKDTRVNFRLWVQLTQGLMRIHPGPLQEATTQFGTCTTHRSPMSLNLPSQGHSGQLQALGAIDPGLDAHPPRITPGGHHSNLTPIGRINHRRRSICKEGRFKVNPGFQL